MNPSFTQFFTTLLKKTPYESYLKAKSDLNNVKNNLIGLIFSRFFGLGFILNGLAYLLFNYRSDGGYGGVVLAGVLFGITLGFFAFLLSLGAEDFFLRFFKKTRKIRNHYLFLQQEMKNHLKNPDFQHAFSIYMTEYIKEFKHHDPVTESNIRQFLVNQYDAIKKSLINQEYDNALLYFDYLFSQLKNYQIDLIYIHKENLFNDIEDSYRDNLGLIPEPVMEEKEMNGHALPFKKML